MNDNPQQPPEPKSHDVQRRTPERADGGEVSELALHGDPSQAANRSPASAMRAAEDAARRRGVVWVRPSELASQVTARAAGRGIDFHAELARRARRLPGQTVATSGRAISERSLRLPPITAFGRRGQTPAGATRSGIGLR